MSSASRVRAIEVRHLQLGRALIAAAAALMITFSPDHSAQVGLSVFSGFALATALVLLLAVRAVYPAGARWPTTIVGAASTIAALIASIGSLRSTTLLFVLIISWAALTGVIEVIAGARALRGARTHSAPNETKGGTPSRAAARDTLTVGILSLVLAVVLVLVPSGFALQYYIEDAGRSFTLTGTTIGVGIFGGYAAVLAVYLGIAALSPRPQPVADAVGASQGRGAV